MSATELIPRGAGLNAIRVEIGDGWVVALASGKAKGIFDLKKYDWSVELAHGVMGDQGVSNIRANQQEFL